MEEKKKISNKYKTLAKQECANWSKSMCNGSKPCKIENDIPCKYFKECVLPLLNQK